MSQKELWEFMLVTLLIEMKRKSYYVQIFFSDYQHIHIMIKSRANRFMNVSLKTWAIILIFLIELSFKGQFNFYDYIV